MTSRKISIRTLGTYARLLGPRSLAYTAYTKALNARHRGEKVVISMYGTGFAVTVEGQTVRFG